MIAKYGSDWAKETIAKSILKGETIFAIGYSEPNAGTDLASLKTQALPYKEGFKINGQKIWTSLANYADYIWLAARTNNEVKKHKGISMFIVPTDDDGFSYMPIRTLGDVTTNMTYYDDIYVSKNLGTLRYSVPEFIKSDEELNSFIISINEAEIKDGGAGALLIKLKNL